MALSGCDDDEGGGPDPGAAGSSDGAEEGSDPGDGAESTDGAALGPVAQGCHDAFVTDDEIADCQEAIEAVVGDGLAVLEACASVEFDHVRLGCMTHAAVATWDVTAYVAECVELVPGDRVHHCVLYGVEATWNVTGLPTACAQAVAGRDEVLSCVASIAQADHPLLEAVRACKSAADPMSCILRLT